MWDGRFGTVGDIDWDEFVEGTRWLDALGLWGDLFDPVAVFAVAGDVVFVVAVALVAALG